MCLSIIEKVSIFLLELSFLNKKYRVLKNSNADEIQIVLNLMSNVLNINLNT